MKRVIWIVLDSVGIGAMDDAAEYGDEGSNTLKHVVTQSASCCLNHLQALGVGHIDGVEYLGKDQPLGATVMRAGFLSKGKDTITGHWEMTGIILKQAFQTYPNGFDDEIIKAIESRIGQKIIGNKAASGTQIIQELGEEHIQTGNIIVYTSADSVFQIATHEEIVPLCELYRICEIARELLVGRHLVSRVIARPFIGEVGGFIRTANRKDYALDPPQESVLDILSKNKIDVYGVGKIVDIFNGNGIAHWVHTKDNNEGIERILQYMDEAKNRALIYANLVDFDMKFGHRNDVNGYAKALEEFDLALPKIMEKLTEEDWLVLCADHGCDPKSASTDHSREYVPVIVYGKKIRHINLGTRESIADLGATILDYLSGETAPTGESFLKEMI
ncbi:MAG: phosphopentomutase [Eubacteriaceae bacterium]|jgi:phosphopentomutase|nr:phosphopentomutase [Eubacteriaceae bacterium]